VGKEKTGIPEDKGYVDLERRRLHVSTRKVLPPGLHPTARLSETEYGQYGRSRYNRCRYGARRGIYGSDYYGSCRYG